MKTTLRIVPDCRYNEELAKKVKKYAPAIEYNNEWYFDGELEELIGFDLGSFLTLPEELTTEVINWTEIRNGKVLNVKDECTHKEPNIIGIYPVEVLGVSKECTGFFWIDNKRCVQYKDKQYLLYDQRGFVVLNSDEDAMKRAQHMYSRNIDNQTN